MSVETPIFLTSSCAPHSECWWHLFFFAFFLWLHTSVLKVNDPTSPLLKLKSLAIGRWVKSWLSPKLSNVWLLRCIPFFLVHRFIIPFSSWWVPSLGCQTCPRFGTSGPVGLSKSGIPIFAGRIPLREIPRFGREITGRCGSVAKSWGLPPLGCACSGSGGLLAFAEFGSEKRQWKRLLL